MNLSTTMSEALLQISIERFLVAEADLLDRRDFEAWLDLLDVDVHYLIPVQPVAAHDASSREGDTTHANTYVDESKPALVRRIRRMELPNAWSERPPTRICRFVSNVRIAALADDDFAVASSVLVYRTRLAHDGRLFAGARRDRIRRVDSPYGWRIVRREVELLDAVIDAHNLSIIF